MSLMEHIYGLKNLKLLVHLGLKNLKILDFDNEVMYVREGLELVAKGISIAGLIRNYWRCISIDFPL